MRGQKEKQFKLVFQKKQHYCPDCSFNGNYTQVKLHLRVTHRYKDKVLKEDTIYECCNVCKKDFTSGLKLKEHRFMEKHF